MSLSESAGHINGKLKVLTFGAGAIGTYIGGSLALAGHQVVFVEQQKVVEELREKGMRLDLTLDARRKTKDASLLDPSAFVIVASLEEALRYGPFDLALFALKSFDTQAALEGIRPFADKMPPILCLSNGVSNEPAIAEVPRRGAGHLRHGDLCHRSARCGRHRPRKTARRRGCKGTSALGKIERRAEQSLPQLAPFRRCGFDEMVEDADQPDRQSHLRHSGHDRRGSLCEQGSVQNRN